MDSIKKIKPKHKIKCKFCDRYFILPDDYVIHLERLHNESIPEDMVPWQFYYYLKTGKTHGNCVMCKADTSWNDKTKKYNRFCTNPRCKEKYRDVFKTRMIGVYGKVTLLDDPEQQRKMLANRSISSVYSWSTNPNIKFTCSSSYELAFLKFLDLDLDWDPGDIMMPSPHNYTYQYDNKSHIYFPDVFIPSLELEIEIKDGGDNPNLHPKIQEVDKEKERLKDAVMMSNKNSFNYIKIKNKEHMYFLKLLEVMKIKFENEDNSKLVLL